MDFNSMFRDVMSLVKERQTPGRWAGSQWVTGSQSDAEEADRRKKELLALEYGKDIDKQRLIGSQQLSLEGTKGENAVTLEGVRGVNTLAAETARGSSNERVQDSINVGALARQQLAGQSAQSVAETTATSHVRGAELAKEGTVYASDRQLDANLYKTDDSDKIVAEYVKGNPLATMEDILGLRSKLRNPISASVTAPIVTPAHIVTPTPAPARTSLIAPEISKEYITESPAPRPLPPIGSTTVTGPDLTPGKPGPGYSYEKEYMKKRWLDYIKSRPTGPMSGSRSTL